MTVGDTVRLKSGGPAMTVAALLGNVTASPAEGAHVPGPSALCEWFDGDRLERRVWPVACLEPEGKGEKAFPEPGVVYLMDRNGVISLEDAPRDSRAWPFRLFGGR